MECNLLYRSKSDVRKNETKASFNPRETRRKQSHISEKARNRDRLNHAPDHADTALLLIDVINDLEFEGR
jgi:hypothetical protein